MMHLKEHTFDPYKETMIYFLSTRLYTVRNEVFRYE